MFSVTLVLPEFTGGVGVVVVSLQPTNNTATVKRAAIDFNCFVIVVFSFCLTGQMNFCTVKPLLSKRYGLFTRALPFVHICMATSEKK
jgi:hypothetical protein